ncbi:MAG: Lrp/AsnC family transcriptional regulator [Oscillospiraceae bacterium]|nr:Lrp/AsnC family transcriptional regulator [Oscillospiraceae bacterium]
MKNKLISLLRQNARLSNEQLAVMLGTTEAQVAAEIRSLEEQGVIMGYSAIVNEEKIEGEKVTAIIELRVTPQKDCGFDEIAKIITQYEEVERVSLMAGAYDLEVTVKGDNVKDIAMFVYQKLATLSGVLSTATHFVLKTYKEKGIFIETEEKDEREFLIP